ncbi:hypothetical protein Tco_1506320 [Tanacetum coccineum]
MKERGPFNFSNQEQEDDYDFWTDSYASDDDEIPTKQVSQDIIEEVSLTIDEAKLKKWLKNVETEGGLERKSCPLHIHERHTSHSKQSKNPEAPALSLKSRPFVPDYVETGLLWSLSVFIRSSVIWERVHDFQLGIESYQQKVNLTAPTISFPGVEKHKMFLPSTRAHAWNSITGIARKRKG